LKTRRFCTLAISIVMALCFASCSTADRRSTDAISLEGLAGELSLTIEPTRFEEDRIARTKDGRSFYIMAGRAHYRFEGDPYETGGVQPYLDRGRLMLSAAMADRIRSQVQGAKEKPIEPVVRPLPRLPKRAGSVLVDAGHGGKDPGAVQGNAQEKEINLAISKAIVATLKARGIRVLETRTTDHFVSLDERVSAANDGNVDLLVSIHANSAASKSARGVEGFYPNEGTARSRESERLAADLCARIAKVAGTPSRGSKRDPRGLRVLKASTMPAVLLELGFLTNSEDKRLLLDPKWRSGVATAIADGIADYLR
jgi:N-acetylmuramoyl-L-alanine amidase